MFTGATRLFFQFPVSQLSSPSYSLPLPLQIEYFSNARSVFLTRVRVVWPKKNRSETVVGWRWCVCVCVPNWALLSPTLKMPPLNLSPAGAHSSLHTPTCFIGPLECSADTVNNTEWSDIFASPLKCSLFDCVCGTWGGSSLIDNCSNSEQQLFYCFAFANSLL